LINECKVKHFSLSTHESKLHKLWLRKRADSEADKHTFRPRCIGCGVQLQTKFEKRPGYLPPEAADGFPYGGRKRRLPVPRLAVEVERIPEGVEVLKAGRTMQSRTQVVVCQRCFRLQNYHDLEDSATAYVDQPVPDVVKYLLRRVKQDSLVLLVVDFCDFEASLVPELFALLRSRRLPTILCVNKVDCLPSRAGDRNRMLYRLKLWTRQMARQAKNAAYLDLLLVSAATGFGFDKLEDRMKYYMDADQRRWIYVMGRTNAGKSTLVNRFLGHVGYAHLGKVHLKQGVGGLTRSAVPGTSPTFNAFPLAKGHRIIDTPGANAGWTARGRARSGLPAVRLDPKD
jgi:GTP-binding protein EngB required for normal cell division